jgi:hypothetical protein
MAMEKGPLPGGVWGDAFAEATAKVPFFLFFHYGDLFSFEVVVNLAALAVAKYVMGDVMGTAFSWAMGRLR